MIIYKCVLNGDEMFSDIYKIKEDDCFYEVEGKMITRAEGSFDGALFGANESAEETSESTDQSLVSGVDIVINHKLQETGFKKADYKTYIKDYLKLVKKHLEEHHPEKVAAFAVNAAEGVQRILKGFKDYQFYTGESMDPDAMVALLNYREDGITPYMLFWKDGLALEKC